MKKNSSERTTVGIRIILLVLFLVSGLFLVLVAIVKTALADDEFGTANKAMENSISQSSSIYKDNSFFTGDFTAEEMVENGWKLDFSPEESKDKDQMAAENMFLELKELYENKAYEAIYEHIDVEYLTEKKCYIYKESYEFYLEEFMSDYEKYTLRMENCRKLANNTYEVKGKFQTMVVLSNGERGYEDTDKEFNFTIRLKADGTVKYLPFNEQDLFVLDDYGVTRIKFN